MVDSARGEGERGPSGVLDPADERPEARQALRLWLSLWHELALRPQHVHGLWACAAEPQGWLDALGVPPLLEPVAERIRASLARDGVRLVPVGSTAYPRRLARLPDPPLLLAVRGSVEALTAPAVAIVGSRAATVYGTSVARELAGDLARAGLTVVSGLARGVDRAAHTGALDASGLSIALQACGPDRIYPAAHRDLAARLAEQGAVVTEFPPGTPPRPPYFPLRNRLISGLAEAVVVVEGRPRSGSLVTARHAADQGVEVLAVPGPVDAATSRGPNELLRDGARPALGAGDVLEAIGRSPALSAAPLARDAGAGAQGAGGAPARAHGASCGGRGEDEERGAGGAVLAALARERLTRDELARALGRSPHDLAPELLALELEGRVAEDRDGRLRAVASPPRTRL